MALDGAVADAGAAFDTVAAATLEEEAGVLLATRVALLLAAHAASRARLRAGASMAKFTIKAITISTTTIIPIISG